jgi:secreted trypsin-like serine protease
LEQAVDTVAPRKLATKAIADEATDGRVVGFGATDASGMFGYGVKRFVDVPAASPSCRRQVDGKDDSVTYGYDVGLELVAGRPLLEQDSCNGDSGGPFYVLDKTGAWVLAGATSRATDSAMHGCGDGGVYVRIDRYRTWIDGLAGVNLPRMFHYELRRMRWLMRISRNGAPTNW